MLVGRLTGTVGGRPWSILMDERTLSLRVADLWSVRKLRKANRQLSPFTKALRVDYSGVIRVKVGAWPMFTLPRWAWAR